MKKEASKRPYSGPVHPDNKFKVIKSVEDFKTLVEEEEKFVLLLVSKAKKLWLPMKGEIINRFDGIYSYLAVRISKSSDKSKKLKKYLKHRSISLLKNET